jgi:hypothetical protein
VSKCKECQFWGYDPDKYNGDDDITDPIDEDTFEPKAMPFKVRLCNSPNIVLFERNPNSNGVSLCDGSNYRAKMYTGEDFGCVNFKEIAK